MKEIDKRSYKKHMGKILVDEDFILFRPQKGYRVNSNCILVKNSEDAGFIFECPPNAALSVKKVTSYLKLKNIDENFIKFLLISHGHQDHFANIKKYQEEFSTAKTIIHKNDFESIQHPFRPPSQWKNGLIHKGWNERIIHYYSIIYKIFSHFYFKSIQTTNRIDFIFEKDQSLKIGNSYIQLIQTPGHSPGHYCILDSHKNLYVADLVPFTPWCCPIREGMDNMMHSIQKVLNFSENQVKRIIKSHGDIRIKGHENWEIARFHSEKKRYQFFLDSIETMLDEIPNRIAGKIVSIDYICTIFNPNYAKYSKIMKTMFIPPAISWAIAYALKLESEGKIQRIKNRNKISWTA